MATRSSRQQVSEGGLIPFRPAEKVQKSANLLNQDPKGADTRPFPDRVEVLRFGSMTMQNLIAILPDIMEFFRI